MIAVATPEMSPPPPIGDDDDVDVRQVVEDLESGRAVAGDQLGIVERVDEREPALLREPLPQREHLADVAAVDDDLGAVVPAGLELRADGRPRA